MALEEVLNANRDDVTPALEGLRDWLFKQVDKFPTTSRGALSAADLVAQGKDYLRGQAPEPPQAPPAPGYGAAGPTAAPPATIAAPAPAARAPTVRAAPAQGALSPYERSTSADNMMPVQPGALQDAAGPAVAPVQSLEQKYAEATAKLPKEANGKLSDDQKKRLDLEFYLGLMARSARPGAYALGAAGESGLDTMKTARENEATNLATSTASLNRQRDDIFKQLGLADKDADNSRADRREKTEAKRYEQLDERDRQRLDLLRAQVAQGKWKELKGANGNIYLIDAETGATKDTGIKHNEADKRSPEERLIERFMTDPKFRQGMEDFQKAKKPGDVTDSSQFKAALDLLKGDMTGKMTVEDAAQRVQGLARQFGGGGAPVGGGDVARPKSRAELDALPKGAKYLNPSDGKTYVKN